ncbi:MAG: O-methyltransferase [Pirellulales bacterium]|nr:O-methyltransferase [Pirellulales bacterium]
MSEETWTIVDDYLSDLLVKSDAALEQALAVSIAAGLPAINVTPNQGKLLHLMARAQSSRNILELGTLGGYSTIWLARALPPGGWLITLEYDPKHADVARTNILHAGLADRVEIRVGRAIETLPRIAAENRGSFDFVFIDADKPSTADYFEWALRLTRPGSLIVVDNVVRKGAVVDAVSNDANVQGVRRFLEMAAAEPRVDVTAIQTVGSKGYDGFALALVVATS